MTAEPGVATLDMPPPFPAALKPPLMEAGAVSLLPSQDCELTVGQLPTLQHTLPSSSYFLAAVSARNWFSALLCRTRPRSGSTAEVTPVGAGRDEWCQAEPGHAGPHSSMLQVPT